ncbi:MAG: ABC transporter ATP-binding protein [Lachnospiraceae bacterium]|nr:ABC transporter ATP-binding protein [Lachnospiraceae bacterium]
MLELKNVNIAYNGTPIVRDVSLTVGDAQIVGIVGESGSGKSTLIRSIIGLLGREGRITSGKIIFDGEALERKSEKELCQIRGSQIAMIFQQPESSFDPIETIGSQFCETLRFHQKMRKKEAWKKGTELLAALHFEEPERVMSSYPFELSGGMCQRAAIALGMACRPKLLLADEPTSALDVTVQAHTARTLLELRESSGTSILMVTHNMGVIAYMADLVGVMYRGRIVEWGTREDILLRGTHEYTKSLIRAIPRLGGSFQQQEPYRGISMENGERRMLSETHWIWTEK